MTKPLGQKAYGSIPHLPGSRLGPGDHHCHPGQQVIATTKPRDKHDRVIVTEKLDGSNVCIAKVEGQILAINRAGYLCQSAPHEQHQIFAHWVRENESRFDNLLADGERACGEWLAQAHGTIYQLPHEPFVVFDIMAGMRRTPWAEAERRCAELGVVTAGVISDGPAFSIEDALAAVAESRHGALDPVEGAVWRVERKGEFDFMAKFVRHDKVDGKYFPQLTGGDIIWNWTPRKAA